MLIVSNPTRLSLGSADHQPFSQVYGGVALNIAFAKRIYTIIRKRGELEDFSYRISYSKTELCHTISEIELPIVKAALQEAKITKPLEIIYAADVPVKLGLATSSSFAMALIKALYLTKNIGMTTDMLVNKAYYVEREMLDHSGGFQDYYCSFGGINYLEGSPYKVVRHPINLESTKAKELEDHMFLIYTGNQETSHHVLQDQLYKLKTGQTVYETLQIKSIVQEIKSMMLSADFNPMDLAYPVREMWELKKKLANSMSSPVVEDVERKVLKIDNRAGFRLVGGGGGRGFILVICHPGSKKKIKMAVEPLLTSNVQIDWEGIRTHGLGEFRKM